MRAVRSIAWVALLLVCIAIAWRASYTTDLSAFLPQAPTPSQRLLVDQLRSGPVSRLLLLGIEGTGDAAGEHGAGERARLSKALAAALRGQPDIGSVSNGALSTDQDGEQLLFRYRYLLGDAVPAGRLSQPGLADALREGIDWLASPLGIVYRDLITRDPTAELIRLVERIQPEQAPRVVDGTWASTDGRRAVLLVRLDADGTEIDRQQAALERIDVAFQQVRGDLPARLLVSGTARFSVASRAAIERDVTLLSGIGTTLIVGLLLFVYRSPARLVLGLVPVVTGGLAAVAVTALVFGQVHAITLGFGVALIGESIDYAIYLFVQGSGPRLWRTVRLGVLTSVIGFSSLLISSFPGLAQLGCFAVTGILVAAVTSRFLLADWVRSGPAALPAWLSTGAGMLPGLRRWRWVPVVAMIVSVVTLAALSSQRSPWASSLESLSPIAQSDRDLDTTLRGDLRAPDLRHLVTVLGPSEDAVLTLAARVSERLQPLLADGVLGGIQSPATLLPAAIEQLERQRALPDRAVLQSRLADATTGLPLRAEKLQPFVDDVVGSRELAPLTARELGASDLGLAVTSLLVPGREGITAMLPLQAAGADGAIDVAAVSRQLAAGGPLASAPGTEVQLLDLKRQSDALYGAYLTEAMQAAAVGAALIVAALVLALARRERTGPGVPALVVAVLLPLLAAVLCVTALLAASGVALTLLHLVGLLLTVAVGSNYTLFFADRDDDPRVLASLLLANATTLIGFGILGFSDAPVLAAIGQTVGPGAALCLLFGAMSSPRHDAGRFA